MLKPRTFVVSAWFHADLLNRIAILFHRLNIPIEKLSMNRIDSDRIRFTIEVLAEPQLADRITTSLAKVAYLRSASHDIREQEPAARTDRSNVRPIR